MTGYRLAQGGRIDRATRLSFSFDGRPYAGHPGDTLASALLAAGVSILGRSFKYHRPRGLISAGASEPNALVTLGEGPRREPNARASMVELHDGLIAESQNRWPSLDFDLGSLNGLLSPFLAAGFYYKTFMGPARLWEKLYEPLIRRAAGLGRAALEPDPDLYEKSWAHTDLLIVGAGPAGLFAALVAARAGADVILADENPEPGGCLAYEIAGFDGETAEATRQTWLAELRALPNVRLLRRTTVFGWYDDMVFGALERSGAPRERLWRIAARRALLCTGAEPRPLVFGGNDRPGVMLAEAAWSLAQTQAVAVGRRVGVFASDEAGARAAKALKAAGVEIAAQWDARNNEYVHTTHGKTLRAAEATRNGKPERVELDALLVSGGHSPRIHLACQRGARPRWSEPHAAFLAPENTLPLAGAANGAATLTQALGEAAAAAAALVADLGRPRPTPAIPRVEDDWTGSPPKPLWRVPNARGKAFVDFQNDVTADDIALSQREGYDHVELAKRYTTNGMATDQGKLSNLNAIGLLAQARGVTPAEVGTTTFRPFYTPVSFGALAGAHRGPHYRPVRRSPLENWAKRHGAVHVESGLWLRSSWFPRPGETHWRQSVDREARAVRENVGLCDVSTLGKIELIGPDVGLLLDRVYSNRFSNLAVGKARYGLMLREDGFVYDDGTTSRLEDERWLMTTTTAQAAGVLAHLDFCSQVLWPELKVRFASVTDQWAQIALAGPRARETLSSLVDADLSHQAFPYMAARAVTFLDGRIPGRLFRVSFSGELAYEIAVPAAHGDEIAQALTQAGATPYGVEAMAVLRIEKGHVTHNEINGTVTADDLGLGRLVARAKPDFIGRVLLDREGLTDPDRPQLVGILPLDPRATIRAGAHVLNKGAVANLENDQGYLTSACYSPHLASPIALALVKRGRARHGEEVVIWNALQNEYAAARLVSPVFVDPDNRRLHV